MYMVPVVPLQNLADNINEGSEYGRDVADDLGSALSWTPITIDAVN